MTTTPSRQEPRKALFPTLTGGRSRLAPEEVAQHQRSRLEGAMLEAVTEHGYASTTVAELVALAGISKSDFYKHFDSKADCFLATLDQVFVASTGQVSEAFRRPGDFRERLVAALGAFMDVVIDQPGAATFAVVESLSLGAAGATHRQGGSEAFELMFKQSFEHSPTPRPVSAMTIRAIVAGIRGVVYRALRAGRPETLPGEIDGLVDWALSYQEEESDTVLKAMAAASRPAEPPPAAAPAVDWAEPPDSSRSRSELSQRERIVRAAARVVVERGYDKLSIPTISAAAGTSHQTFYEHFSGKGDAFLAAFEMLGEECLRWTAAAFQAADSRPEAVGAALRAMLEYVAANELFARLAFFELPTAGAPALDRADAVMDTFAGLLGPDDAPGPETIPEPVLRAISSGAWEVIQFEIAQGRRAELPERAAELVQIVLVTAR